MVRIVSGPDPDKSERTQELKYLYFRPISCGACATIFILDKHGDPKIGVYGSSHLLHCPSCGHLLRVERRYQPRRFHAPVEDEMLYGKAI